MTRYLIKWKEYPQSENTWDPDLASTAAGYSEVSMQKPQVYPEKIPKVKQRLLDQGKCGGLASG